MTIDRQKLKDHIWGKCMTLCIEMEYSKSKVFKAKYEAYKEIWDGIENGMFEEVLPQGIGATEDAQAKPEAAELGLGGEQTGD